MIVPARPGPGWPHNPSKGRRPTNSRASDHVDPHEDGRVVAARNQSRAKTRAMLNPMDWTQPALERHRPQDLASRRGDRRRVVLAAARKPSPRSGHIWIGQEPIAAPDARRGHPSSHDTAAGPFLESKERLLICAFAVFWFSTENLCATPPKIVNHRNNVCDCFRCAEQLQIEISQRLSNFIQQCFLFDTE